MHAVLFALAGHFNDQPNGRFNSSTGEVSESNGGTTFQGQGLESYLIGNPFTFEVTIVRALLSYQYQEFINC